MTAAWGTQHSVAKAALDSVGDGHALELTAARFLVAALALAQFRPKDEETWRWGAELGVWSFLGFALQTIGLETTTATRSAFLLYLNVKFVPLLELVNGKTLPRGTWLSAFAALSGTLLLAADSDTINGSWAPGDSLSVLAALASACFIIRLEPASQKASSPEGLASATALSTALLAFLAFWQTGRFQSSELSCAAAVGGARRRAVPRPRPVRAVLATSKRSRSGPCRPRVPRSSTLPIPCGRPSSPILH